LSTDFIRLVFQKKFRLKLFSDSSGRGVSPDAIQNLFTVRAIQKTWE
jgi:hypothetical protein